jgi:hypothetical protein
MSMFDRQGIPEGLVRGNGDGLQFEDAVAPLVNYSLILPSSCQEFPQIWYILSLHDCDDIQK